MALSVVDLYKKLPQTNCKDCGLASCLAFASMAVAEKLPVKNCPHLDPETAKSLQAELDAQHQAGKWTKRDMAEDALVWAKERAASMKIADLPERIGGELMETEQGQVLRLPYFTGSIQISQAGIASEDGQPLNRWEQTFLYNHLAQGGSARPSGEWKGLEAFPNTVSKIKSMRSHVEAPLEKCFQGRVQALKQAATSLGGVARTGPDQTADAAFVFTPLPRVPVMLLFWDAEPSEGFDARAKLLFDRTITQHLDIESILFLSERLHELLCQEGAR